MTVDIQATAAIVVVDLQRATASIPSVLDMTAVVANAASLAAGYRERGRPRRAGENGSQRSPARTGPRGPDPLLTLVPELGSADTDIVLDERGRSAFAEAGNDSHRG